MIKTCPICKSEFNAEEHKRKYCSYSCNNRSRIKNKKRICVMCGKGYDYTYLGQKYCSVVCKSNSQLKIRLCKQCGNEILQKNKKKNREFCSRKCYIQYKKENRRQQFCKKCGKEIINGYNGRVFCSRSCYLKYTGETSIEKIVREYLIEQGILFDTQVQFKQYVVDFILPLHKTVIEADGEYWHNKEGVIERDEKKDKLLEGNGYKVIRLQEYEIKTKRFRKKLNEFIGEKKHGKN